MLFFFICLSCDDEPLEATKVTFHGTAMYTDRSLAANTDLHILIRANRFGAPDTTTQIKIPVTTDNAGNYFITMSSDNFPAFPFYIVEPAADSLALVHPGPCPTLPLDQQIFIKSDNIMNIAISAAAFLRITFRKNVDSNVTNIQFNTCSFGISIFPEQPDTTFTMKLPYDVVSNPFEQSYLVSTNNSFWESRSFEALLQPYKTTEVVINY